MFERTARGEWNAIGFGDDERISEVKTVLDISGAKKANERLLFLRSDSENEEDILFAVYYNSIGCRYVVLDASLGGIWSDSLVLRSSTPVVGLQSFAPVVADFDVTLEEMLSAFSASAAVDRVSLTADEANLRVITEAMD
ncbi:MAG: hypothetical protein AAGD32_03370 [Planctomycetota bacterium]